jgi:large subunit ribosomal protein L17
MAAALFQHGAIRTTEAKAKELRRFVEKLITIARQGTLHARRRLIAELGERDLFDDEGDLLEGTLIQTLMDEIGPRYTGRDGGYTRIIRLAEHRIGDAGTQVLLQLVEEGAGTESTGAAGSGGSSRRKQRAAKRYQMAAAARKGAQGSAKPAEDAPAEQPAAEESSAPADEPAEQAGDDSSDDSEKQ